MTEKVPEIVKFKVTNALQRQNLDDETVKLLLNELKFTKKEVEIINYSKAMRISEFDDKKLSEVTKNLVYWAMFLNVDVPPLPILDGITKLIVDNYSNFTLQEIQHAILLSTAGALNVDNNPYNNFNPIYVTRILKAYNEYRGGIVLQFQQAMNDRDEAEKSKLTDEQKKKILIDGILARYKVFIDTGLFEDFVGYVYDFLEENNYICFDIDCKKKIYDNAEAKLRDSVDKIDDRSFRSILIKTLHNKEGGDVGIIKVESKKIAVIAFFSYFVKRNKSIQDYFANPKTIYFMTTMKVAEKILKEEKECFGCLKKLAVGETVTSHTENLGGIQNTYWCDDCVEFANLNPKFFEGGITHGEFGKNEEYKRFLEAKQPK